jgi:hypothetical protein
MFLEGTFWDGRGGVKGEGGNFFRIATLRTTGISKVIHKRD